MPGPKPNPKTCFTRIYSEITRLYSISETDQQLNVLQNLLKGLEMIEPLWIKPNPSTSSGQPPSPAVPPARNPEG
jgi:hypothetical protein